MFDQLFPSRRTVNRHRAAPAADARESFLEICLQRGANRRSLTIKAQRLYRIALALKDHPDLKHVTDKQLGRSFRPAIADLPPSGYGF